MHERARDDLKSSAPGHWQARWGPPATSTFIPEVRLVHTRREGVAGCALRVGRGALGVRRGDWTDFISWPTRAWAQLRDVTRAKMLSAVLLSS